MASKKKVVLPQVEELVTADQTEIIAEPKVKKVKLGIGSFIVEQIMTTDKTNQQILNEVKAKFESCQTSYACVAWYKSKLRKEGKIALRTKKEVVVEAQA